ncbi:MarR family winged helix-turn-helix transcriptional regulator [Cryptosporangium aurantiacum]|uniref:DNA-binding transcriptional regulator, MarR family n=1 Tax=Cryptosporangium aurantiacum TaxID=134849 RepID=A0A1M7JV84_9ACTN|nr:MarR family transcriptional regulator [Cryptosporangium aurantiacum]SHM56926.1 DNA-binding transcriptional regulator, MarR family [Cryptosporangium aurantiacum]
MAPNPEDVAAGLTAVLPVLMRTVERRLALDYARPKPPDAQLALLRLVGEREGITVREAADALLMKANNVSALVSHLVGEGLLTRVPDENDRRVVHLHPTADAREQFASVDGLTADYLLAALDGLDPAQVAAIGEALPGLIALARRMHAG